jgi:hypothetical protein
MSDDDFPLQCEQCGARGQALLYCSQRYRGRCPYQLEEQNETNSGSWIAVIMLVFMLLGACNILADAPFLIQIVFSISLIVASLGLLSSWFRKHSILVNKTTGARWSRTYSFNTEISAQVLTSPQPLAIKTSSETFPALPYSVTVLCKAQRDINMAIHAIEMALLGLTMSKKLNILYSETYDSRFGGKLKRKKPTILIVLLDKSPAGYPNGWLENQIFSAFYKTLYPLTVYEVVQNIYRSPVENAPMWLLENVHRTATQYQLGELTYSWRGKQNFKFDRTKINSLSQQMQNAYSAIEIPRQDYIELSGCLYTQIRKAIWACNINDSGDGGD